MEKEKKKQEDKNAKKVSVTDTKRAEDAKVNKDGQAQSESKSLKKEKKKEKVELKPKEKAVVRGVSLRVSLKHCIEICKMLRGKTPKQGVELLGQVVKGKRVVPMRGREVAHQKSHGEKNIAGGKFPKNASLEIIKLLKQLKANADVAMIEEPVIVIAKADTATRPFRRAGRRAKRCHVYLEVKSKSKLNKEK